MTSDVYILARNENDFRAIPAEAERIANFNKLGKKETMRLRLLAEELICMLPQLLTYGAGRFWIENEHTAYELHVSLTPDEFVTVDREKLLSVSKSGKNAAAVGILSKICIAVEKMMNDRARATVDTPFDFYDMGMYNYGDYQAWSLMNYRSRVKTGCEQDQAARESLREQWDELEKSIITNLADDVTVGVKGGRVDIAVIKKF